MIHKPDHRELSNYKLDKQYKYVVNYRSLEFFNSDAGIEHYSLLAWFSHQYPKGSLLIEVGTLDGCGMLALSHNQDNRVISWDVHRYGDICNLPPNTEARLVTENYMDTVMPTVMQAPFIFYDAKHEGKEEREFLDELVKRNWHGIVMWDDIHLNKPMKQFWNSITQEKEDWTDIGHFCGTGIVHLK